MSQNQIAFGNKATSRKLLSSPNFNFRMVSEAVAEFPIPMFNMSVLTPNYNVVWKY